MATFRSFEELDIWHKARELTRKIYNLSNKGLLGKDFALRDQIRRACISIMANVAEGFERSGTGEFLQFLAMAKGSAGEVRSLLYIALDQGYVEQETFSQLSAQTGEIGRMIGSLMNYLKKSKIRGAKYKT